MADKGSHNLFTDAELEIENIKLAIHKIILCKCSATFRALFIRWSRPEEKHFVIVGVPADALQLVIEYVCNSSNSSNTVALNEKTVQDLLQAAGFLGMRSVSKDCYTFLGLILCPKNCVSIYQLAKNYFYIPLEQKAFKFVLSNFEVVESSEEFPQLDLENLCNIVAHDGLCVSSEAVVFRSIIRWVTHAIEDRREFMPLLLSKVRLCFLSVEYIRVNISPHELLSSNALCKRITEDAFNIIGQMNAFTPPLTVSQNAMAYPRFPKYILLATGGWSGNNPTDAVEAYDISTHHWVSPGNQLDRCRAYHGVVFLNGCVYSLGGFDRLEKFNHMQKFDFSTGEWSEVAPMHCRRCYISVTVLNGKIYAMGGYDGYERLKTAEAYNPETNQWTLIASMNEQRSDASCATFKNKIYICGGFNGTECLQTCENYNPEVDQWTSFAPMTIQRSGVGVIASLTNIYAIGGSDGTTRLRTAEVYNPELDTWIPLSSMQTPRSNFGIELMEGFIFVIGGFNGETTICKVEYYNIETDEWKEADDMDVSRSGLSCCLVKDLPHINEYIFPREALHMFRQNRRELIE